MRRYGFETIVLHFLIAIGGRLTRAFPAGDKSTVEIGHYGSAVFGNPNEETGKKVSEWNAASSEVNPEELGEYLEGDILFPNKGKNGLLAFSAKWDGGIVPYVIAGPYSDSDQEIIHNAIKQYHDNTCIRRVCNF